MLLASLERFPALGQVEGRPLSLHDPVIAPVPLALLACSRRCPGRRRLPDARLDLLLADGGQRGVARRFAFPVELHLRLIVSAWHPDAVMDDL